MCVCVCAVYFIQYSSVVVQQQQLQKVSRVSAWLAGFCFVSTQLYTALCPSVRRRGGILKGPCHAKHYRTVHRISAHLHSNIRRCETKNGGGGGARSASLGFFRLEEEDRAVKSANTRLCHSYHKSRRSFANGTHSQSHSSEAGNRRTGR